MDEPNAQSRQPDDDSKKDETPAQPGVNIQGNGISVGGDVIGGNKIIYNIANSTTSISGRDQGITEGSFRGQLLRLRTSKLVAILKRCVAAACIIVLALAAVGNDRLRSLFRGPRPNWLYNSEEDWIDPDQKVSFRNEGFTLHPGQWASPRYFAEKPLSDFSLHFRLSFAPEDQGERSGINGNGLVRAEWVLRSTKERQAAGLSDIPGYHFQLVQRYDAQGDALRIRRYIVTEDGTRERQDSPEDAHTIGGTLCCSSTQALDVSIVAVGSRITHCRSLQDSKASESAEVGATFWDTGDGFRDFKEQYDSGGIVFGAVDERIFISDLTVRGPPAREFARCFFSGKLCWPLGDDRRCP